MNRHTNILLNLKNVGSKRTKELKQLIEIQNSKMASITFKLDLNFIYITFDYNAIKTYEYTVKQNRVMAVDLNPNSIGWFVVDWLSENKYNVVQAGTFSLEALNDYEKKFTFSI